MYEYVRIYKNTRIRNNRFCKSRKAGRSATFDWTRFYVVLSYISGWLNLPSLFVSFLPLIPFSYCRKFFYIQLNIINVLVLSRGAFSSFPALRLTFSLIRVLAILINVFETVVTHCIQMLVNAPAQTHFLTMRILF